MYKPLENLSIFNMAHTNGETVVWNDNIDIAPETLYEKGNQIWRARRKCRTAAGFCLTDVLKAHIIIMANSP